MNDDTFIICTRTSKNDKFVSEPGITQYLAVSEQDKSYSPANSITRAKWRKRVMDAADGKEDSITGMRGDVLVFIHGYNNDIPTVLWRTRTLQRTLREQGWKGVVVGFDWPSANSTLNYLEDRSDASAVSLELVRESLDLLVEAQTPKRAGTPVCKLNVHLIAHSTGAYVIMEAFAQAMHHGNYFKSDWRIGQVAFIGGDVSTDSLTKHNGSHPMFDRIMRLTNYSNGCDKVLAVSNAKRLGIAPRVGRVGLPPEVYRKAVNVDCTEYFQTKDPEKSLFCGTFNHSWHIGDPVFALDLALTLEGEIDRGHIPTRIQSGNLLSLRADGARPTFQSKWDTSAPEGK